MNIHSICVCGAGTMGSGIAQAAAQAGYSPMLYELNPLVLDRARNSIGMNLQSLAEKGKITAGQQQKIFESIRFTGDIASCIADVFIEAIVEKPDIKIALFNQLAGINHPGAIFASNTSSLAVSKIAESVVNPGRVIGMHFFNPATIMKLVEVVNTKYTDKRTTTAIIELARQMGKTPVICRDSPGFIVNRVARPFYIESLRLAEKGHVDFITADRVLEASGFRMGPFKLMDLIGNDINYAVSCSVYEQLNNPERLKPSYIQEEYVREGKLGRKAGEGYYKY
jgi:3-hydroxybutyryl-CoA dehydrogenase